MSSATRSFERLELFEQLVGGHSALLAPTSQGASSTAVFHATSSRTVVGLPVGVVVLERLELVEVDVREPVPLCLVVLDACRATLRW
jgi:hypothetical protein